MPDGAEGQADVSTQAGTGSSATGGMANGGAAAGAGASGASNVAAGATATPWGELTPEDKGFVELHRFENIPGLIKQHRELLSLRGVPAEQLIKMPGKDAKPEETTAIFDRLGRPKTPDEYKLPVPEGGDGAFAKTMSPLLHAANLTQDQAAKLAEGWNGHVKAQIDATLAKQQAEIVDLEREWGSKTFTERKELARRAKEVFAREQGLNTEQLNEFTAKMENAVGTAGMIKLFAFVGNNTKEAGYVDGNAVNNSFGMTPAAALEASKELIKDREFAAKIMANPDGPEARRLADLQSIAASGGRRAA